MCDFIEFDPFTDVRPTRPVPPAKRSLSRAKKRKLRRLSAAGDHSFLEDFPPLLMATTAWQATMAHLTGRPPEAGGILIGPINHDAVTNYVPDLTGLATTASFTFDHEQLNELLRRYVPLGFDAKGVAHSHPAGCLAPSGGDLRFVSDCFAKSSELDRFYMPIVVGKRLFPYVVYRGESPVAIYSQLILF